MTGGSHTAHTVRLAGTQAHTDIDGCRHGHPIADLEAVRGARAVAPPVAEHPRTRAVQAEAAADTDVVMAKAGHVHVHMVAQPPIAAAAAAVATGVVKAGIIKVATPVASAGAPSVVTAGRARALRFAADTKTHDGTSAEAASFEVMVTSHLNGAAGGAAFSSGLRASACFDSIVARCDDLIHRLTVAARCERVLLLLLMLLLAACLICALNWEPARAI
jgi:hypothetical protein